jgi:putative ABC transport system permease protein
MLIFSIKNAFRKKGIAILASLGVGFGLMLVFVLGAFSAGVSSQFRENVAESVGQVQITEKLKSGSESQLPINITEQLFNTEDIEENLNKYNLEAEAPIYFTINYVGEDQLNNEGDRVILKGLNKSLDQNWEGPTTKIEQGRVFENGKKEIIVDSRLLDVAQFNIDIGSELEINLNIPGTETENLTIVGYYSQEDNGAPDFVPRQYSLYMDIEVLWDLLDESEEETNYYSTITLSFDAETTEETNRYVEIINNNSEDGEYDPTYLSAVSVGAFFESIEESLGIIEAFTGVIGLITVIAGGMAIIVTQLMNVSSRMKEFAILKATGWKNRHIFQNVIYESLTLGAVGALIGLGLGAFFINFLGSEASPLGAASAIITIEGIIEVIAYALGLGVIGGLFPGIKASRVRPVKVLKGG